MAIFITGDTHGLHDFGRFGKTMQRETSELLGRKLDKNDCMIIAGDFGVIWDCTGQTKTEDYILKRLENLPWTTLFIDGNHENFTRLSAFQETEMFGGTVGVIRPSVYHLKQRGHVYEIGGKQIWCFGGGTSVDKYVIHREEGVSWWSEEEAKDEEYIYGIQELGKHNWKVDYVVTHAAPQEALDSLNLPPLESVFGPNVYQTDHLPAYLQFISQKLQRTHWYFGHYHEEQMDFSLQCPSAVQHLQEYSSMYHSVKIMSY